MGGGIWKPGRGACGPWRTAGGGGGGGVLRAAEASGCGVCWCCCCCCCCLGAFSAVGRGWTRRRRRHGERRRRKRGRQMGAAFFFFLSFRIAGKTGEGAKGGGVAALVLLLPLGLGGGALELSWQPIRPVAVCGRLGQERRGGAAHEGGLSLTPASSAFCFISKGLARKREAEAPASAPEPSAG